MISDPLERAGVGNKKAGCQITGLVERFILPEKGTWWFAEKVFERHDYN